MSYNTFWENKGVRWKFHGSVTSKEVMKSNMDIYGDPRFDSIRYQIADFTEVLDVSFNEKDMQKIAYLDRAASRSNPQIKVALIAPTDSVRKILKEYSMYSMESPWVIKIFESLEAVESWLHRELHVEVS